MAYVKAAERHEQIVAAAIRVLSEVGVPGTTLRAVAAEAGIPLGTLHYVFPSKDQMLRAVIAAVIDDVVVTVPAPMAGSIAHQPPLPPERGRLADNTYMGSVYKAIAIHWAGTETASDHAGYIEGAIESGLRVAQEVAQVLSVAAG